MTVGNINTSNSVSNPDVHGESFSLDLTAVDIFPPIPDISIDDISLRDCYELLFSVAVPLAQSFLRAE